VRLLLPAATAPTCLPAYLANPIKVPAARAHAIVVLVQPAPMGDVAAAQGGAACRLKPFINRYLVIDHSSSKTPGSTTSTGLVRL